MMLWFWIPGWFLSILTVFGNGLLIYLITTRQQLHTSSNWFVLSLGVADFGVGFWLFPPLFVCQVWGFCNSSLTTPLRWYFLHSSVSNLCAMALDRHLAIARPLRYVTIMNSKRAFLLVTLAWGITTVCFFIPFSILSERNDSEGLQGFFIFVLVFLKIFPIVGLFLATSHILWITRKASRSTAHFVAQVRFNTSHVSTELRRVRKDPTRYSARLIVALVCLFFLCYTIDIYFLLCDTFKLCSFARSLSLLKRLLLLTNSALNPLTYAFLKQDIKREMKRFFRVISHGSDECLQSLHSVNKSHSNS